MGEGGEGGRYHYGIPVRGLPGDYVHTLCANVDDVQSQESRCASSRLRRVGSRHEGVGLTLGASLNIIDMRVPRFHG